MMSYMYWELYDELSERQMQCYLGCSLWVVIDFRYRYEFWCMVQTTKESGSRFL